MKKKNKRVIPGFGISITSVANGERYRADSIGNTGNLYGADEFHGNHCNNNKRQSVVKLLCQLHHRICGIGNQCRYGTDTGMGACQI